MPDRVERPTTPALGRSSLLDSASDAPRPAIPEAIGAGRIVAIGRRVDPAAALSIAEALVDEGIRAYEITLQGDGALRAIEGLVRHLGREGGLAVGAGTVLSIEAAESAIEAGASFLVMPHLDPAIVGWAAARGIAAFPGAFTPTEIVAAWRAGAAAVKLFPASAVGPAFVRELRGPFPEIGLVPTGGLTLESAPAFLAAGAVAIGIGSWLTGDADPAAVRRRAARLVEAIATAGVDR